MRSSRAGGLGTLGYEGYHAVFGDRETNWKVGAFSHLCPMFGDCSRLPAEELQGGSCVRFACDCAV